MEAVANRDKSVCGEPVSEDREFFTVKQSTFETITTRKGWGVVISLVYAGEDDPDHNEDDAIAFDLSIVSIEPRACRFTSDGTFCVQVSSNYYIPVENFGDDEDDLAASRYFETYDEALNHSAYVRRALKFNGLEEG